MTPLLVRPGGTGTLTEPPFGAIPSKLTVVTALVAVFQVDCDVKVTAAKALVGSIHTNSRFANAERRIKRVSPKKCKKLNVAIRDFTANTTPKSITLDVVVKAK